MVRGRKPKTTEEEKSIIKVKETKPTVSNYINLILKLPIQGEEENSQYNIVKDTSKKEEEDNVVNFNKPKKNIFGDDLKPIVKNSKGFKFVKIDEWEKSTDIKCWWCSYNFDTIPCSIPFKYIDDKFEVFGCFCGFNCALAYINESNIDKKEEKISLLNLLYRKIYNKNDTIVPAPKKEILTDYGGNLTIEEFRNISGLNEIAKDIVLPPIVGVKAQIDSRNIEESIKHMKRKSIIDHTSADRTIILKRQKSPIKKNDFMSYFKKN